MNRNCLELIVLLYNRMRFARMYWLLSRDGDNSWWMIFPRWKSFKCIHDLSAWLIVRGVGCFWRWWSNTEIALLNCFVSFNCFICIPTSTNVEDKRENRSKNIYKWTITIESSIGNRFRLWERSMLCHRNFYDLFDDGDISHSIWTQSNRDWRTDSLRFPPTGFHFFGRKI